jgi:hypothetical protein
MWDWAWPIAGGLVMLAWLTPLLSRSVERDDVDDDDDEQTDQDDSEEGELLVAGRTWVPHDFPMGPVSGWPHAVDPPDSIPTRSPADRPDV